VNPNRNPDLRWGLNPSQLRRTPKEEKKILRKNVVYDPYEKRWVSKTRRICPLCRKPYAENKERRCVYCGVNMGC